MPVTGRIPAHLDRLPPVAPGRLSAEWPRAAPSDGHWSLVRQWRMGSGTWTCVDHGVLGPASVLAQARHSSPPPPATHTGQAHRPGREILVPRNQAMAVSPPPLQPSSLSFLCTTRGETQLALPWRLRGRDLERGHAGAAHGAPNAASSIPRCWPFPQHPDVPIHPIHTKTVQHVAVEGGEWITDVCSTRYPTLLPSPARPLTTQTILGCSIGWGTGRGRHGEGVAVQTLTVEDFGLTPPPPSSSIPTPSVVPLPRALFLAVHLHSMHVPCRPYTL
ncbi:hypothetical protein BT67DRAFT_150477 [Trichocladium antarcticum]|uniref:Uncharacterized protein n=1 Tax=Trichocladium antarcticum TaxID=1450529 RepID=A0AAN6UHI0_9PEZI|nr:hypothetical protein BT67DRAFT_150477 [Trichocladium antarcticum]